MRVSDIHLKSALLSSRLTNPDWPNQSNPGLDALNVDITQILIQLLSTLVDDIHITSHSIIRSNSLSRRC